MGDRRGLFRGGGGVILGVILGVAVFQGSWKEFVTVLRGVVPADKYQNIVVRGAARQ